MKVTSHIPNFLTLCNLVSGALGITFLFGDQPILAAIMIWVGGIFDFLDGFAARWLKSTSPIGKELDSLADMVTFSLLPSFIVYYYLDQTSEINWLPYLAFYIAAFSALRLAKFNIDERQTSSFLGLPTPANAIAISAIPFYATDEALSYLVNPYTLIGVSLVLSVLMVSEVKLFSLKFKGISWGMDKWKIVFLIFTFALVVTLHVWSFPVIILLYIMFSLFDNISNKM